MVHAESAADHGDPVASPSADAVREELGRVQKSADFDVPERAKKFLGYVVEETLAGRAERIKAYSIALEVFGRDASFDAQADPVVRIEAGRVRRALERYYLTGGKDDEVLISIPKGGYVPHFEARTPQGEGAAAETSEPAIAESPTPMGKRPALFWAYLAGGLALVIAAISIAWAFGRQPAPEPVTAMAATPGLPTLLIEPFEDLTGSESSKVISRGMTDEIIGQVARFKDLIVIDGQVVAGQQFAAGRAPRYILAGSVRTEGDAIRLTARLRSGEDDSILWARSFDADRQVKQLLSIQAEIAREVSTALAQPYGVIFQTDSAQVVETPPDDWRAYTCTLAYYTYRQDLSPETYAFVRGCLERTVAQFPTYATAWALLSIAHFDGFRFLYSTEPAATAPIDRAMSYARRAVDLDPQNARGQQALMMAHYLNGEVAAALEVGRRALELNPNDIELRGEYGVRLALSGKWKEGGDLILDTLQRSAGPESYYETTLALCAYMLRDNANAAMWIRKSDVQANPLFHFIAAAIFGHMGAAEEAALERDWILENGRPLLDNVHEEVALRIARPEDQAYLIEGFALAGLPIPPRAVEAQQ